MSGYLFSGSEAPRVAACPASVALPRVGRRTVWSNAGDARHKFLATVAEFVGKFGVAMGEDKARLAGRSVALGDVPYEFHEVCAAIDVTRLPVNLAAEVAFAYDTDKRTARELGRGLERSYASLFPSEIPLTMDVIGLSPDGEVGVYDYKGQWANIPKARDNWQVKLGVLAACRTYGANRAHAELIHLGAGGEAWHDAADWDAIGLDMIEEEFAIVVERARRNVAVMDTADDAFAALRKLSINEGAHCSYCPAYRFCPAKTALLRVVAEDPAEFYRNATAGLTDEQAATAYASLRSADRMLRKLGEDVKAFAIEHPILLPDGKVYGQIDAPDTEIQIDAAQAALLEEFASEGAVAATTLAPKTTTKAALERAVKPLCERGTLAGTMKGLLESVADKGGLIVTPGTKVLEMKRETFEARQPAGVTE